MDSKGHLILVTIFFSLFVHFPSRLEATPHVVNKLVAKACTQSDDPKVCVRTLLSHPRIKSATNLKAVAEVALKIVKKEAINIRNAFNGMMKAKNIEAFKSCASYFNEATTQLNLRGLPDQTASLDVHYALDDAVSCETALADEKIVDKSILSRIQNWKHLYSIAGSAVIACEESA